MQSNTDKLPAGRPAALLLEDDLVHGALLRMVLEASGFAAPVAATLDEALGALNGTLPNLILVGWDIDGIDGRAILGKLRARVPGLARVPVLLMTDRELCARTRLELALEGYTWVLQKPIVMTSLPKLIAHVLAPPRAKATPSAVRERLLPRFLACATTASSAYMDAVR